MPRPMKFWEVISAFRDMRDVLAKVFGSEKWRDEYLETYRTCDELVRHQDRQVLDALVPVELTREIAACCRTRFWFYPEKRLLREAVTDRLPDARRIDLTALEVHDRFGGSAIEEVPEYGSARVRED